MMLPELCPNLLPEVYLLSRSRHRGFILRPEDLPSFGDRSCYSFSSSNSTLFSLAGSRLCDGSLSSRGILYLVSSAGEGPQSLTEICGNHSSGSRYRDTDSAPISLRHPIPVCVTIYSFNVEMIDPPSALSSPAPASNVLPKGSSISFRAAVASAAVVYVAVSHGTRPSLHCQDRSARQSFLLAFLATSSQSYGQKGAKSFDSYSTSFKRSLKPGVIAATSLPRQLANTKRQRSTAHRELAAITANFTNLVSKTMRCVLLWRPLLSHI